MKTRFDKDVDGPFVEVTLALRDQDDSPEFNFYSLSPDDRTKLCEHLPRKVNGLRARCDHSEAEPTGHRVAALLRAMDDAAKDAVEETDDRPDHVRTGRPFAYVEGLREAARLVREHLGAPSPEDFVKLPRLSDAEIQAALDKGRAEAFPDYHPLASATLTAPSPLDLAVAEVVASPLSDHAAIEISGADDAIEVIGELHAEREADTDRSLLLSIARVALAGMLACDAKGGSK